MMLSLHGRPSTVDGFAFHLAEKLGKTVTELQDMDHAEYAAWNAYFVAKQAIEGVRGGAAN